MRDWRSDVRARLAELALDPGDESEIVEEIAADLDERHRALIASGAADEEAERRLLDELRTAPIAGLRARTRLPPPAPVPGAPGGHWLAGTWQDLRHGCRMMRATPQVTLIAVVTLALGIGASTAMFSVFKTVLLEPLPFPHPDRLVQLAGAAPRSGWQRHSLSHANFWDFLDLNRAFSDVGAITGGSMNLTGRGPAERLSGVSVSVGFFRALGVAPAAGRLFVEGEDAAGGPTEVVVLSHRLWTSRFGGDPHIVGQKLTLDGRARTVVGVAPPGTPWLDAADIFVPLVREPTPQRGSFELDAIARLKTGISPAQADADLKRVSRILRERFPDVNGDFEFVTESSSAWTATGAERRAIWVLMGAVACLLLIASVNLVNLLAATATARAREVALRSALGASRGRIIRQLVTESLALGLVGATLGLLVAFWIVHALRHADTGIARLAFVTVDARVLWFAIGVSLLTTFATGLAAALHGSGSTLVPMLREGERGAAGSPRQRRVRQLLVGSEVALAMTLLVAAGLLVRSFDALLRVDRGFEADGRLMLQLSPPSSYEQASRLDALLDALFERVRGVPGVQAVAAVSGRPLAPGSTGLGIGRPGVEDDRTDVPWASWRFVTPDYFRAMGVPVLKGRAFRRTDAQQRDTPMPTIVSRRVARLLYPDMDPIGQSIVLWKGQGGRQGRIVGVVGDMRERGLAEQPTLAVYFPYAGIPWLPVELVVQTANRPESLLPTIRTVLADLDPQIPISHVRTLEQVVADSLAARRFVMTLLLAFAAIAALLALGGIHGVLSYTVGRRTAEIGVRMALGATAGSVLRLIVGQGMRPVVAGLIVGIAAALALTSFMTALLVDVAPTDAITYGCVSLAVLIAGALACVVPARRALRVDVMTTLRAE